MILDRAVYLILTLPDFADRQRLRICNFRFPDCRPVTIILTHSLGSVISSSVVWASEYTMS